MHAMQYPLTLPADYDMGIIRERVATRGHVLDDRAGLGLKAYLVRERGDAGGSPVNQYAPFYLWHDQGAMAHFLAGGGGFQGIVADFGRPVVQHWTGLACAAGPARTAAPRAATRLLTPMPAGGDPAGQVEEALAEAGALARTEGVHTVALAFDPRYWELMRFVLWEAAPAEWEKEAAGEERYEVLHLSAPGLEELPRGRAW
ncbi:DUF4865 domain-containing protein [Streptomyces mashuensis]|uniref:DUF4865 domain-containing protein n=1 Tax=Streptomyces mashuensis TaxID=33904 RepID=A0A919AUD0_9ACTN|nr:DUF4865 family protein [Streptomyces mashuensis]GHF26060.1 DUF4865 domain-containing protein [Streptomyces mashuensis]